MNLNYSCVQWSKKVNFLVHMDGRSKSVHVFFCRDNQICSAKSVVLLLYGEYCCLRKCGPTRRAMFRIILPLSDVEGMTTARLSIADVPHGLILKSVFSPAVDLPCVGMQIFFNQ